MSHAELPATSSTPRRGLPSIDKVIAAILIVLIVIAVISLEQAKASVWFTLDALIGISPFLAASVVFAALSKACGWDTPIATVFRKNQPLAITMAAFLGALSPFCSCGVIPIIAGLLRAGVPLAPVMAFWLASPLMDPEMFILMVGSVGLPFTLAKTAAAAMIGLISGFAVYAFSRSQFVSAPLRSTVSGSSCSTSCGTEPEQEGVVWAFWRDGARLETFRKTSVETMTFLLRWLTLAFLLESLMVAYIPAEVIASWLGTEAWWTIPVSALAGIPAYLNGYAAIPLVRGLMEVGMLPGAALAFMIGGGVTSVPAAMAVYVTVNRGVFSLYLILGLSGAMLTGWLTQAFLVL